MRYAATGRQAAPRAFLLCLGTLGTGQSVPMIEQIRSKVRAWPRTPVGAWALGLIVAFAVLFVLKVTIGFPLMSFAIFGVGIVGVILGIIAVVRRERSLVLMIVGGLVGAFILFWLGGELLAPH